MKSLIFLLIVSCMAGCAGRKVVSETELKAYVLNPENGLLKKKNVTGIDMEVLYRPSALVIAQQNDGVTDKQERRETIRRFDSLIYFVIRLSRNGQEIENAYASDPEAFARISRYLSSTVAENIYLETSGKKLPALDAVYTRMFGSAPATTLMAVFDADAQKLNGKAVIHFDDTVLGLGDNAFEFDTDDIKNTPTINQN